MLDDQGIEVQFLADTEFFFPTISRLDLGSPKPPIQWMPEVKPLGHEADPLPLEVKDL
jgi:hypothetical protein